MEKPSGQKKMWGYKYFWVSCLIFCLIFLAFFFLMPKSAGRVIEENVLGIGKSLIKKEEPKYPPLDKEAYDAKLRSLAHLPEVLAVEVLEGEEKVEDNKNTSSSKSEFWPVITEYPKDGAILPFYRVVAYYGNLYSKKMGVLGEYEESKMLSMLDGELKKWQESDPTTPVLPALHYIAMVAQNDAGKDGKYRARMPDSEIDKILAMAEKINAIVFLDIQVGLSDIETELPKFEKYLKMERVHLGIDPEFYMKSSGKKPGSVIGTMDAKDINFAMNYLAGLVKENDLPPKILIIHRFTQKMVTNYENIIPIPEVQIVMNMDGWGGRPNKLNTYKQYIYKEPVQFTGFKLFYKNDTKEPNSTLLSPEDLLKLTPAPIYIQYQ